MNTFTYDALPGRVVFGVGISHTQLASEIERLNIRRILVIASIRDQALAKNLTAPFTDLVIGGFAEVRPHVPIEIAEQARTLARALGADCLLAIGGGSAIGTAKAIALEQGQLIVAIPTTYAGSEMTPIYGLTIAQRKQTGRALVVLPRLVVYDPELTLSLPVSISGPSAMNAMAHCVEAFYGPAASPITSLIAEEGIRALAHGVPLVVAQPGDLAGRSETLYGAYLAGVSLAAAGTSFHHKICHILGGAYDLPHAELHTVVLPHAVAYLTPAMPDVMRRIARALGVAGVVDEATTGELVAAAALSDLALAIGAPRGLREIGLAESELAAAATLVFEQLPNDLPRPITQAAIMALLTNAFWGHRPGNL